MRLVWWMVAGSLLSSFAMTALLGAEAGLSILLGVIGPLIAVPWTSIAVERMHKRHPEAVTSLLIKAFTAKMAFFAGYMFIVFRLGLVRPIPFMMSFTGYFLALHITAAFALRRLSRVEIITK